MTAYFANAGDLPRGRLGALIDRASGWTTAFLRGAYRAWLDYRTLRRTIWECERLSDRQLDDLGLSRSSLSAAIRAQLFKEKYDEH